MASDNLKCCSFETTQIRMKSLVETDFPEFACLLGLLAEHRTIEQDETLAGAVSALQSAFARVWDMAETVSVEFSTAVEVLL